MQAKQDSVFHLYLYPPLYYTYTKFSAVGFMSYSSSNNFGMAYKKSWLKQAPISLAA